MSDRMLEAYIEAALWATIDYGHMDNETGNGPMLDANYGPDDIEADTRKQMADDCEAFWLANEADIHLYMDGLSYGPEQVGHDFWLTREGHGAGFWDRYYGPDEDLRAVCNRLAEAAKAYGEFGDTLNDGIMESEAT